MLHFNKTFKIYFKNRCCRCLMCNGAGVGLGDTAKGWSPGRRMEGKREVPGAPQREQRQHSPSPRETEALRTGKVGKKRKHLTHLADGLSCGEVPTHSMSTCTEQFLPFPSPYKFIELVLIEAHILSWRWKGSSRGALRISRKSGKEAVAELQSSALPVSTILRCGVFSKHLSFHPCFQTSTYA